MSRLDLAIQNAKNTLSIDSTYASFGENSFKGRGICTQIGLATPQYWDLRRRVGELLKENVLCLD